MSQQIICPRGASLYIWRQGDTLASVALRNRVTVQSIYLVNEGRDLDALRPGDRICLPPGMYACLSGQAYTVRRGDTFVFHRPDLWHHHLGTDRAQSPMSIPAT